MCKEYKRLNLYLVLISVLVTACFLQAQTIEYSGNIGFEYLSFGDNYTHCEYP